ncbi:hypothetical protein GLOIN_2v1775232 [Rhizophagus clarus]|uniref:Uncharacterized protein n=1 Tax=Rhizophagus clarus TaxID=94130 RepID=A0A8H3QUU1_9GLOM|nr:hypothetical protein GLOIN_2v1775232 [Rhizophagus clarus]
MSVYKAIASLELYKRKKKALRILFTDHPSKKTEAEEIILTCTDKEQVDYLRELLTSGKRPLSPSAESNRYKRTKILAEDWEKDTRKIALFVRTAIDLDLNKE